MVLEVVVVIGCFLSLRFPRVVLVIAAAGNLNVI